MEHGAYKELLSALLDGELHGAEREEALAHLETCADCRAYFAELTALRAALSDWEQFDAPEGFAAGVMARLHADGAIASLRAAGATKPIKRRTAWRGYAALAACAAVVLLAVHALPNALRVGGARSGAADNVSSSMYAPQTEAAFDIGPTEDAPAKAPEPTAPAAGQASDSGYGYAYAGGSSGAALEGAWIEEAGVEEADLPAAANERMENSKTDGVANSEAYVTTGTEDTNEKLFIGNSGEMPMRPLSSPEAIDEGLPLLTLSGEGAEAWLAEHGWQGESGAWYAEAEALRALPENLLVVYSDLPEDYDGAVYVELWEAEP